MIFQGPHITLIEQGLKTQTRRLGKKRWIEGHVYPVKRDYYSKPSCHVRVLKVFEDRLGNMTAEDAKAEGYSSLDSYKAVWERIWKQPWNPDTLVWVIEFRLVQKDRLKQSALPV